ncbi:MAG: hypothetical protein K2W78_01755 [Xanthobacteraceae bacterium]|nr:hypothetical protein [Xanthobacteraceae bacterium]
MSAKPLTITDLSALPRLGFKGRGTLAAMQAKGLVLENQPNRAFPQSDGLICMVLAASEVFLLGAARENAVRLSDLENSWRIDEAGGTYPLLRRHSHAWFSMQGASAPEMLAKLCAVDFRTHRFTDFRIAQTSVARLNSIVLRADADGEPTYHLLADSASRVYMLACLQDAAEEFGGRTAKRSL